MERTFLFKIIESGLLWRYGGRKVSRDGVISGLEFGI